jgi:DNA-nicking Smr family endonuclease
MSDKGKTGRRRNRTMSSDEAQLWSDLTRSIEPLKRRARHIDAPAQKGIRTAAPVSASARPVRDDAKPRVAAAPYRPAQSGAPGSNAKQSPSTPGTLDRRRARRIASGQMEIEARLDLHGLRQDEAHRALRGFLSRAHNEGHRTVLVITGKGRVIEPNDHEQTYFGGREPGVLKQNVPRWLRDADLARFVVSYTTASSRHGGDGALYVQLRRRQQTGT